jgi:hypothetical protein
MKKGLFCRKTKRILRLPDLDHAKTAVLNTLGSPESQRSYRFAIKISFLGFFLNQDWPSTRPSFCVTGCNSKLAAYLHPRSMCA